MTDVRRRDTRHFTTFEAKTRTAMVIFIGQREDVNVSFTVAKEHADELQDVITTWGLTVE